MEAAVVGVAFLLAWTLVNYRLLKKAMVEVRHDAKRLEQEVESLNHAKKHFGLMTKHAVATAERAERKAYEKWEASERAASERGFEGPIVVVVQPSGAGGTRTGNGPPN